MKKSPFVCRCGGSKSRNAKECATCATKRRVKNQKGHGTVSRYINMGCRCDKCKKAWRIHQRGVRAKQKTPTKGTS